MAQRVEKVVEDEIDVGGLQINSRLEAQLQIPIAGAAGGKGGKDGVIDAEFEESP